VVCAFIVMYLQGINANIMSLGGIAIAIGAMVDGAIVMIENVHKHIEKTPLTDKNRWQVIGDAASEVGRPLFFSLIIITISFMPIFALQAQEGKLFSPLAYTKTYAMAASAGLAITLVPVLMGYCIRGKIIAEQNIEAAQNPDFVRERSTWVLIKDMEQEACFILMFWALAIMGYKAREILHERKLLDIDLVAIAEGMRVLPEDTREFSRQVEDLPDDQRSMVLPRALLHALRRFSTTRSIQDVSSSTHTIFESEADRLESELSMIRYISWAIPSIGFIGTVRGIGEALAQADKAVQGDIAGVTQSLGVAFNSTFIALLISIFLMFLVYQLQLLQERLVFDSENYLDDKLIRHMKSD
jgi:biopolymer transport protein ExbB/TolQ